MVVMAQMNATDKLLDLADMKDQARDWIIDRLLSGKSFSRINARDIFDCALNSDVDYHNVLDLLESLLSLSTKGGDDLMLSAYEVAEQAKGFIERFVDGKPEWIEEVSERLAAEAREE